MRIYSRPQIDFKSFKYLLTKRDRNADFLKNHNLTFMGRDAIRLAKNRFFNKENPIVLMPAYTCREVIRPFQNNMSLTFYDVKPNLEIDLDYIKAVIDKIDPSIFVLIHYYGFPLIYSNEIIKYCRKKEVTVIEDCSHALLTHNIGQKGQAAIFSLRKLLPIYDGGSIIINNQKFEKDYSVFERITADLLGIFIIIKSSLHIQSRLLHRSSFASTKHKIHFKRISYSKAKPRFPRKHKLRIFPSSRWTENYISNLDLEEIRSLRIQNYYKWLKKLKPTPIKALKRSLPAEVCPIGVPIMVPDSERLIKKMKNEGIDMELYWEKSGEIPTGFLGAGKLYQSLVGLPVYPGFKEDQMDYMLSKILGHIQ